MKLRYFLLFFIAFSLGSSAQDLAVTWYNSFTSKNAPRYEKVEFGIQLPREFSNQVKDFVKSNGEKGINPFIPDEISLDAEITGGNGKVKTVPGFFYVPYKRNMATNSYLEDTTSCYWRVRTSFDKTGVYKIKFVLKVKNQLKASAKEMEIKVVPSNHRGNLTVSPQGRNQFLRYASDSSAFFGVGMNVCHATYDKVVPKKAERYERWINKLADNKGNFVRFELGALNGVPNWFGYKNYLPAMDEMWERDNINFLCEKRGIYFSVFRHHVEVEIEGPSWNGLSWQENPFVQGMGIKSIKDYFTNEEVFKYQKYCDRYIFARWGYSANFVYYGYSEVDNWLNRFHRERNDSDVSAKDEEEALGLFVPWFKAHKNYIKSLGYDKVLFGSSYARVYDAEYDEDFDGVFKNSDVIPIHMYNNEITRNYTKRFEAFKEYGETFRKPVIIEEAGYLSLLAVLAADPTGNGFHNDIWSTSFMGFTSNALWWWWDRGVFDFGHEKNFLPLSDFTSQINWNLPYDYYRYKNTWLVNNAEVEAFYMMEKEGNFGYGWVNNLTYNWRNYVERNPRLKNLVDSGYILTDETFEDDYPLKTVGEKNHYKNEGYIHDEGRIEPVLEGDFQMKISGLKRTPLFGKNHRYRIKYYRTDVSIHQQSQPLESYEFESSIFGSANVPVPELKAKMDGFYLKERCFIIEYLGLY